MPTLKELLDMIEKKEAAAEKHLIAVHTGVYFDRETRKVVGVLASDDYYEVIEAVHEKCGNNPWHVGSPGRNAGSGFEWLVRCGFTEEEATAAGALIIQNIQPVLVEAFLIRKRKKQKA